MRSVEDSFCAVCQKITGIKNIWKRGGGEGEVVLRLTVGSLLSHKTESFRRGTLHCFRITLVSKKFKHIMGSGYHDFPSKLCCLTQPKVFVGEPFRVPEYFW